MRRETQNVVLVLVGGALLKIAFAGTYLRYVKPALLPWLIGSGAVIVALGAVAIALDIRRGGIDSRAHGLDDGHGHSHGQPKSPWLLLLPVLAILLVAPPALGADSVSRADGRSVVDQQRTAPALPPLPPGPEPLLRMSDFATRVVWDRRGTLNGRTIRLSGFVVRDPHTGQPILARLVITCCAADAMPVKARLVDTPATASALTALVPDEWVEVTGQALPNSAGPDDVPAFRVSALREIPAPADPYEY